MGRTENGASVEREDWGRLGGREMGEAGCNSLVQLHSDRADTLVEKWGHT